MKYLEELIEKVEGKKVLNNSRRPIESICYDSRKCIPGALFVAMRGTITDGHKYIETALSKGATAVLCEETAINPDDYPGVTFILTNNSRRALAAVSHAWYGYPSETMKVIGVTGTNGKTTSTFLLRDILESAGYKCGIIGTTGIFYRDRKITATHTTPESLEMAGYFAEMKDAGVTAVIMEVSSHALHQHRADYISFDAALFTNLTHEHLDYHKTMTEYAAAKKILFDMLPENSVALVNDSGEFTGLLLENCKSTKKLILGTRAGADVVISGEKLEIASSSFNLFFRDKKENISIKIKLPGRFNIENASVCAALAIGMGIDSGIVAEALLHANGAPGRMQRIPLQNGSVGIVDYAHTPDALEKALKACREILEVSGNGSSRLICVFGCGGDRDTTKRPLMGKLSTDMADYSIITNDNPRTEDPEIIFRDILAGIDNGRRSSLRVIPDRAEAIETAAFMAEKNDIILVAGKGHEDYQIIGKEKYHFDDAEQLMRFA
ncbi:MAG TPA: UDP-N-acetylmuramoyl-L-alanyl-D-glutamate--2,6-diaminopimelate ligase [Ignavibacteriales bacterium]|nr:UDP-N-acetylmuramoyl-L-alanyl-D-glutamate--2,6-diaminopimelate ligase [Ignavibacteriales bacterium]